MTKASQPPSSATGQNGGGQPTPHGHDPRDEQPRHHDRAEQGEQWQHGEPREQALITTPDGNPAEYSEVP
jgi:hypothetical protein